MKKNIINTLREKNQEENNKLEWILKSYDAQTGSYIEGFNDTNIVDKYHINGKKVDMVRGDYYKLHGQELAKEISNLEEVNTILEVGVGEATTLYSVMKYLGLEKNYKGFDISLSRVSYGKEFVNKYFTSR